MPWLESWPSEQPWHCNVCNTTFEGKEMTYIPGGMCEIHDCPGPQERRRVEVMPVSARALAERKQVTISPPERLFSQSRYERFHAWLTKRYGSS
jgi:hypothetical protein